jgi:serine/threonine protein kinase
MEPELKSSTSKKYKQVQVLGKGSFGTVYKVQQGLFGKPFAIKQIYGAPVEETKEEFNIQFSLVHPNVAKVRFMLSILCFFLISR